MTDKSPDRIWLPSGGVIKRLFALNTNDDEIEYIRIDIFNKVQDERNEWEITAKNYAITILEQEQKEL